MYNSIKRNDSIFFAFMVLLLMLLAGALTALLQSPSIPNNSIFFTSALLLIIILSVSGILLIVNHFHLQSNRLLQLQQHALEIDRSKLLVAVSRTYPFVVFCYLEENRYELNCLTDVIPSHIFGSEGTYDHFFMQCLALTAIEDKDSYASKMSREALLSAFVSGKEEVSIQARQKGPEGVYHWLEFSMLQANDTDNKPFQVFLWKNVDSLKAEEALRHAVEHDGLTDAYSRKKIESITASKLEEMEQNTFAAFTILDIDDFKNINDTYGHMFGDTILVQMAQLLKRSLSHTSAVGRLGGDEFIIFTDGFTDTHQIHAHAQQICSICNTLSHGMERLTVSVGIAVAPTDGTDYTSLYEKADLALYCAKKNGKNQYIIHPPSLSQ